MKINVTDNAAEVLDWYADIEARQIPFALAKSLTRTAYLIAGDQSEQVSQKFDRPKAQTVRAFLVTGAKKADLTASVRIKSRDDGGVPAENYLSHSIESGMRMEKNSEAMIKAAGILPAKMMTAPGAGAKRDAYGNMQRGQIAQILSYFRTYGLTTLNSARMNMTDVRRAKVDMRGGYFIVLPGSKLNKRLFPGVYKKMGNRGFSPILNFINPPAYSKRIDFYGRALLVAESHYFKELDTALTEAMRTAR